MGIFGRVPSGGGSGTSRRDRREAGVRGRSRTVAKRETEQRAQLFVIAGIALAAIAIVGVGVFGYVQTSIRPGEQTVLKVGDKTYHMSYVKNRLAYEINKVSTQVQSGSEQMAVLETLTTIENEEITRLNAAQQNVTVSDDEIDAQIRSNLGVTSDADQMTFANAYRLDVKKSGLSPSEYRDIVAASVLESKIKDIIKAGIPANADQVHLFDIEVSAQTDAQSVVDRLSGGENFGALAKELSQDQTNVDKGGEMGWEPKDALDPAAADAVFALQPGQWTQPIQVNGSYYVYEVTEKGSAMPLTDDQKSSIQSQLFQNQESNVSSQTTIDRRYLPISSDMWNKLVAVAAQDIAKILSTK